MSFLSFFINWMYRKIRAMKEENEVLFKKIL